MPCLRATVTGDTPCCRLSAAISRFCSAVQRRRRSRPVINSMRRLRMLVRLVVGVSSESNATAITLSSFLKDDRWPNFPRVAQCAAAISLTLDVSMNEDQLRNRMGHGPANLAVLRHMALNLLRKETSKGSLPKKLRRAALSNA